MTTPEDFWAEDDFEDTVAAALIACFETKVKKNRGAAPADRMTEERVAMLRADGPYIASNSRILVANMRPGDNWYFDVENDPLPLRGCYAFRPGGLCVDEFKDAYLFIEHVRKVESLGRYWHKRKGGTLYEMLTIRVLSDGIDGERRYFTVTNQGEVVACTQRISDVRGYMPGVAVKTLEPEEKWLHETSVWASVTLQSLADRRFCWTITAQEKTAKAHLGCMQEEVKSLLYARSLPMTDTGRKRPILHLVEAHKRRMKNGTDVDVTAFLRGQQTVEIGGTVFKVQAPAVLRPTLSRPSQDRYYNEAMA